MEIAIYPYSHEDGTFSAPRDSGSVVGGANRCIVGIIIGGASKTNSTDVTYASPYYFPNERIEKAFQTPPYPVP